jgi:predicted phage tail protein
MMLSLARNFFGVVQKIAKKATSGSVRDGREGNTNTCSHGKENSNGRKHARGNNKL